jgi:hypothetical protein
MISADPPTHTCARAVTAEILPTEHSTLETTSRSESETAADAARSSIQLETRGVTEQTKQAGLWPSAIIHANSCAAKLREAGRADLADKIEKCHTEWTISECNGCHKTSSFPNRCENWFCAKCQPYLARKRQNSIEWWAARARQPKHVVLTVQNTTTFNQQIVREFKQFFRKLRRTKFASNWRGGFYSLEVTNEGRGWHLHLHALVDAAWIDAGKLSQEWNRASNGLGRIVRVKDARAKDYLHEVCKYTVKGAQLAAWSATQTRTFIEAFESVRTFGVFGTLYGKRTEWKAWLATIKKHGRACECGCTRFSYFTETEWTMRDLLPNLGRAGRPPPSQQSEFTNLRLPQPAH